MDISHNFHINRHVRKPLTNKTPAKQIYIFRDIRLNCMFLSRSLCEPLDILSLKKLQCICILKATIAQLKSQLLSNTIDFNPQEEANRKLAVTD